MTLRARILIASVVLVMLPLIVVAVFIRAEMSQRLSDQYTRRIDALVDVIREDLAAESRKIHTRLAALKLKIQDDNELRAVVQGRIADQRYLQEYAGRNMDLQGLAMLQIQNGEGRIVSSGHFPDEVSRIEAALPRLLARADGGCALVRARKAEGVFLALAGSDSLRLGRETLRLVGGIAIDSSFVNRLVRGNDLAVSLIHPGGTGGRLGLPDSSVSAPRQPRPETNIHRVYSSDSTMAELLPIGIEHDVDRVTVTLPEKDYFIAAIPIPGVVGDEPGSRLETAWFFVSHPRKPLRDLRRNLTVWLALVLLASAAGTLVLAVWLAGRISRPLGELARKTESIDLDHLDVSFESRRRDEVGTLTRLLGRMTTRLRASAEKLRAAERRATLGEVARQVNHDIKNGLTPIRNVFRHLHQVAGEDPGQLAAVFRERQAVMESSITYLEALAANYAKISSRPDRHPCNLGAIAAEVTSAMSGGPGVSILQDIEGDAAPVIADPVGLRRIVENLVRNACESLGAAGGTVIVRIVNAPDDGGDPGVRLTVSDSGPGIPKDALERIFDDFYTTKKTGAGLGLSIVRRLVSDFDGTVRADSQPGLGARFSVWLPAAPHNGKVE